VDDGRGPGLPARILPYQEEEFDEAEDANEGYKDNSIFLLDARMFKSDKLPALYSLAKKLEGLTRHAYHEDHWFDGSHFALTGPLWHAAEGKALKMVKPFRATSWSWASLEGPLEYLDFPSVVD
jgi:hypothetical protein